MIIVGLTGSVGTGKSTVARLFQELGAYVIDWDELAHKVVRPHTNAWTEIVSHFGEHLLDEDLSLNRPALAEVVFADKEKLHELNRIVHPEVVKEDEKITNTIKSIDPDAIVIKDIPLLYEAALPLALDKVIVVYASAQTQLKRLQGKGMSLVDARRRIASQLPLDEKLKSADFVINNNGSLKETRRQVAKVYSLLKKKCGRGA